MASEKLQVILELVTGQYKREALGAAQATEKIGGAAGGVTSSLGRMLGPAAIAGAVVGLGNMAVKAGENADRLFDLQAQTGLTTDALQEWEFVAKTAGAGTEVFSDAVKAVIRNLNEVEGATGAAGKAYETLGINTLDASGKLRSAGDITDEVFTKLAGMENITARNALAQDIFGKKWEETISILDLGSDAIGNARKEAHELGAVVSGDSLRGADKFRESFEKLKTVLSGKLMELLGDMGPALSAIADGAIEIVDELEPLFDGLAAVTGALSDVRKAGDDWAGSENSMIAFFGEYISNIGFMDILTGNFSGAMEAASVTAEQRMNPAMVKVADKLGEGAKQAQFMADAAKDDLVPALDRTVPALGQVEGAQDRAAAATRAHRDALIQLTNRLLAQLNPAVAAYQALQDLERAQQDAADAADEHGVKSEEAAAAQLDLAVATAAAQAALNNFGDTRGAIDALAESLNISWVAAAELLVQLGLLDGTTFETDVLIHVRTDDELDLLAGGVIPEGAGLSSGTTTIGGAGYGSGRRASGGLVTAGSWYTVGEEGPEVFRAGQSGSILSNDMLRAMGRGSTTINVSSPTNNLAQDLQYAALLASVQTMVES